MLFRSRKSRNVQSLHCTFPCSILLILLVILLLLLFLLVLLLLVMSLMVAIEFLYHVCSRS